MAGFLRGHALFSLSYEFTESHVPPGSIVSNVERDSVSQTGQISVWKSGIVFGHESADAVGRPCWVLVGYV